MSHICVDDLRFTHDIISNKFRPRRVKGYSELKRSTLEETFLELALCPDTISSIPALEVMVRDGQYWVVDGNRRLYVYRLIQKLGLYPRPLSYIMPLNEFRFRTKFTTEDLGETVKVRTVKNMKKFEAYLLDKARRLISGTQRQRVIDRKRKASGSTRRPRKIPRFYLHRNGEMERLDNENDKEYFTVDFNRPRCYDYLDFGTGIRSSHNKDHDNSEQHTQTPITRAYDDLHINIHTSDWQNHDRRVVSSAANDNQNQLGGLTRTGSLTDLRTILYERHDQLPNITVQHPGSVSSSWDTRVPVATPSFSTHTQYNGSTDFSSTARLQRSASQLVLSWIDVQNAHARFLTDVESLDDFDPRKRRLLRRHQNFHKFLEPASQQSEVISDWYDLQQPWRSSVSTWE